MFYRRRVRRICKPKEREKSQCGARVMQRKCSRCGNGAKKCHVRRGRIGEGQLLDLKRQSDVVNELIESHMTEKKPGLGEEEK